MVGRKGLFSSIVLVISVLRTQAVPLKIEPAFVEDLREGEKVVAGWQAADGQIPYQTNLRLVGGAGQVSTCGGSLIHHNWVLTAAHCLANRITFVVRIGVTTLTRPEYLVESSHKHIHPQYDEVRAGVQTDDVALIGLDHHIPYGPRVQPARLQNTQQKNMEYAGSVLTVSGFGMTDDAWNGGAASEVLRWVLLRGISNAQCRDWYGGTSVIQDQTICAEYYNDTAQASCQGDSGGPLSVVDADGRPTQVGVVSFGSTAGCNSEFPSAFVRPGHYHPWFLEVTGIDFDWRSEDTHLRLDLDPTPPYVSLRQFYNAKL